ncbi:hypothetical protein HZA41_01570 [Candidatus Peregrinibacteria bacterium]|nr:hypothetical protein [Candidatus Peregrinibacteria bacterium]
MAAAFGINEPIERLIKAAIEKIPGRFEVAENVVAISEKSFAKGILRKQFTKTMLTRGLGRRLMTMEVKSVLKKVLPKFGWRGLVSIGVLSDDLTVIGVIDDVLLLWMGKDVVDILLTITANMKVKKELELVKAKKETVITEERKGEETVVQMGYEGYPNIHEWTLSASGEAVKIRIMGSDGQELAKVDTKDASMLHGDTSDQDGTTEAEDSSELRETA